MSSLQFFVCKDNHGDDDDDDDDGDDDDDDECYHYATAPLKRKHSYKKKFFSKYLVSFSPFAYIANVSVKI